MYAMGLLTFYLVFIYTIIIDDALYPCEYETGREACKQGCKGEYFTLFEFVSLMKLSGTLGVRNQ